MRARLVLPVAFCLLVAASCVGAELPPKPVLPTREVQVRTGGYTTIFKAGPDAYSFSARNLSREQSVEFAEGTEYFNEDWTPPDADTTDGERTGAGPVVNDVSCLGCHVRHGRGIPPTATVEGLTDDAGNRTVGTTPVPSTTVPPSSTTTVPRALADAAGPPRIEEDSEVVPGRGFLLKLTAPGTGAHGEPLGDPVYGTQLQTEGLSGVPAEGTVEITYEAREGQYGDGTRYELLAPRYDVVGLSDGPLAADTTIAPRLAPPTYGLGLLEAIPAEYVLAIADPDDRNDDGVSGRANLVWDPLAGQLALGRFGWKAGQASVHGQVVAALANDMGVTSAEIPEAPCTPAQILCLEAARRGPAPEATEEAVSLLTFYTRTLAVPAARDTDRIDVQWGAHLFDEYGCASCHRPSWITGPDPVRGLAGQTIYPYTDLLLHDLGADLADGRREFAADGREWRTPPLWGIGLADRVAIGQARYLHDGRARTLPEAILWHGGEAHRARERFRRASADERAALVRFLESL